MNTIFYMLKIFLLFAQELHHQVFTKNFQNTVWVFWKFLWPPDNNLIEQLIRKIFTDSWLWKRWGMLF